MRRVIATEQGKVPVEDVVINFFESDEQGNTVVRRTTVEIPLGMGRYAAAAMGKGFVEFFDDVIVSQIGSESGAKEYASGCDGLLTEFRHIVMTARENMRKLQAVPTVSEIVN